MMAFSNSPCANGVVIMVSTDIPPADSPNSVTLRLDPFYLSIFNADKDAWELVPGEYIIQAGTSSRDLALRGSIHLD